MNFSSFEIFSWFFSKEFCLFYVIVFSVFLYREKCGVKKGPVIKIIHIKLHVVFFSFVPTGAIGCIRYRSFLQQSFIVPFVYVHCCLTASRPGSNLNKNKEGTVNRVNTFSYNQSGSKFVCCFYVSNAWSICCCVSIWQRTIASILFSISFCFRSFIGSDIESGREFL